MNENYKLPSKKLLTKQAGVDRTKEIERVKKNIVLIEDALEGFNIKGSKVVNTIMGSAVTQYEIEPPKGIRMSRYKDLQSELMTALAAKTISIQAPIPGTSYVGIEVPNEIVSPVPFNDIIDSVLTSEDKLEVVLGRNNNGDIQTARLDKMPHLLVAGSTGSGKSVGINVIINSILMKARPDEVQLLLVDPKKVEFIFYEGLPHLLKPIISDAKEAVKALNEMVDEMENRYEKLAQARVRKIDDYNKKVDELNAADPSKNIKRMPYIVVIVDELSDLVMASGKEVDNAIIRITQKARAAGIHMILATQRPTTDIVTGTIKANVPSRMSFSVASSIDSKVILDQIGAETLLGRGDMLFLPNGVSVPTRIQGAYIPDDDIDRIVRHIKAQDWQEPTEEELAEEEAVVAEPESEVIDDHLLDDFTESETEEGSNTTEPPLADEETPGVTPVKQKAKSGVKKGRVPVRSLTPEQEEQSAEDGYNSILADEEEAFTPQAQGMYKVNYSPKGKAYGLKDSLEDLVNDCISDIMSQGMPLLNLVPYKDELFLTVVGGRPYHIGDSITLVFDLRVTQSGQGFRKVLMQDEPYKVVVHILPDYESIMHEVVAEVVETFNKHYVQNSNLMVHNNVYYHGSKVTPFIAGPSQSEGFLRFAGEVLKERWMETFISDWGVQVKQSGITGTVLVKHQSSSLVMKGNNMAVISDYTYWGNTGTGTFQMTRVLEKLRINNERYEQLFSEAINTLVVQLNQAYQKGEAKVSGVRLQFIGAYGVPYRWKGIISSDMIKELYERAKYLELDVHINQADAPVFSITKGSVEVICSGSGFYVTGTTIGYIKEETTLADVLRDTKGAELFRHLEVIYDSRRNIGKYKQHIEEQKQAHR